MNIHTWVLPLALLAFGGNVAAQEKVSKAAMQRAMATYSLAAEGDIVIAADGSVMEYKLTSGRISPEIAAVLDKSVKRWRFEPVVINGRSVNAKTNMRLGINAEPYAGGYQLRVTNVAFGSPQRSNSQLTPPRYPGPALQPGVEADVVLILKLDASGAVKDAHAEQTYLSGTGPDRVMQQWRELFEASAIAAAKRWKFNITETINGEPAETSLARIPVSYRMRGNDGWRAMVPVGPKQMPSWITPGELPPLPIALKDGETQSLSSRFKLKEDVIGSVL